MVLCARSKGLAANPGSALRILAKLDNIVHAAHLSLAKCDFLVDCECLRACECPLYG